VRLVSLRIDRLFPQHFTDYTVRVSNGHAATRLRLRLAPGTHTPHTDTIPDQTRPDDIFPTRAQKLTRVSFIYLTEPTTKKWRKKNRKTKK